MAKKRFTDVEIWDKEWFMELKPKHKCLVKYLFDKCDSSGMWKPNWKLASMQIGEDVSISDLKLIPANQYEIIDGKIFLPDFISFQYGNLSKNSPAHKPIFKTIEKNNLSNRVFNRVSDTLQEKETEKEKEEEKEIGGVGEIKQSAPGWQMMKEFKKSFPDYHEEPEKDLAASLKIIYKIAHDLNITKHDSLNGSFEKIKLRWGEIVPVLAGDNWYRIKNLSFIANDWQQVIQLFNNGSHKQPTSQIGQPHISKKSAGAARLAEELKDDIRADLQREGNAVG